MLELSIYFQEFWDRCVLIGGWVPYFILADKLGSEVRVRHVGSLDVDILIDVDAVAEGGYSATLKAMQQGGFEQRGNSFEWTRIVAPPVIGRAIRVRVHLLAPESAAGANSLRRQMPGGLQVLVMPVADVALRHTFDYPLEGQLPTGENHSATIRVADEVACFAMKGGMIPRADGMGLKEKDAYDLFVLLRDYPGGPSALARHLTPYGGVRAVEEAMQNVREQFADPTRVGSRWAVTYLAGQRSADTAEEIDEIRNEVTLVFDEFMHSL